MEFIKVSRDSPSDDEVAVVELLVENGQPVRVGQPIADLEGAKSSYQLASGFTGTIFWYIQVGEGVQIGQVVAVLLAEGEAPPGTPPTLDDESLEKSTSLDVDVARFSKSALSFLADKGLNPADVLPHLGFVTLSDLENEGLFETGRGKKFVQPGPCRVALLGGGRGAEVAREILGSQAQFAVSGVFDDENNTLESFFVPRVGNLDADSIASTFRAGGFDQALVTITSSMSKRVELLEMAESLGIRLITLIDAGALVSGSSEIGEGTVAVSGSRIGAFATLGKNVFMSAFVNVEHHCVIGDNTTFGPGVFLSGGVEVGRNSVFGTNIAVEPGVSIGEGSVISSGATITQNVPPRTVVKSQSQLRFREIH